MFWSFASCKSSSRLFRVVCPYFYMYFNSFSYCLEKIVFEAMMVQILILLTRICFCWEPNALLMHLRQNLCFEVRKHSLAVRFYIVDRYAYNTPHIDVNGYSYLTSKIHPSLSSVDSQQQATDSTPLSSPKRKADIWKTEEISSCSFAVLLSLHVLSPVRTALSFNSFSIGH